jgi:hypothetical protein
MLGTMWKSSLPGMGFDKVCDKDSDKVLLEGRHTPRQGRPVVPGQCLQGVYEFEVVPRPVNIGLFEVLESEICDFAQEIEEGG